MYVTLHSFEGLFSDLIKILNHLSGRQTRVQDDLLKNEEIKPNINAGK
jgi:hypothetical protein